MQNKGTKQVLLTDYKGKRSSGKEFAQSDKIHFISGAETRPQIILSSQVSLVATLVVSNGGP